VTLRPGEVLQQPGAPIARVYFPVDCVIVLLAQVERDRSLEVGLIGHEGMLGISLALGADASCARAVVQAGGAALQMKAAWFQAALPRCQALQHALCRYAHAKLALARQTAACNGFHAIEARLPRWLLTMSERVRSEEFCVTQAFLADLLGVQRTTINEAAGSLQRRGLIGFSRGRIRILDRKRLEAACCSCFRAMSGT
jgi:CRP-like cAMP-binding protein